LHLEYRFITPKANKHLNRAPVIDLTFDLLIAQLEKLLEYQQLQKISGSIHLRPPAFRKDDTPLNRKPGVLMEQSNASLQRGDQG
jgi:hypothetical protein